MVCVGNSFVKLIFFIINFLICIFGALVCGFSLWANLDKQFGTHLAELTRHFDNINSQIIDEIAEYQASLWILTTIGALVCLMGFLGCCGAVCASSVLLKMFVFILMILTAIELSATIFSMSNRAQFLSSIEQILEKCSSTPDLRKNIKPIQNLLQCCGATQDTQDRFIQDGLCGPVPIQYPDNCLNRISHMIQSFGESIVVVAFILIVIQLLSIFVAIILCKSFQKNQYAPLSG